MKKKLFGIIAALSCFACLGGCLDDKAADKDSTGGTSEGGSVAGVNLEAAKAILKSMYFEDEYTNNNVDYEYVTILQNVAGVDYQIEWSVNVTEGVVLENKGGTVLVNVNEGAMNAIDYVLTAKIVAPDGSSIEQQFIRTVKAMDKYVTNGVTATPVAGKDYYLYVYQTTLAQHMYFTGNMDGYYFETTANAEEAVAINVEFVDGSTTNFYPYFVKDVKNEQGEVTAEDVKHYIGMRLSEDGAHNNVVFDTAPITEFYYSTKYQTVVTKMATDKDGNTNAEFYLGNYAANDTISGSLASQYFGGAGNNVGNLVEIVDRTTVPNADKVKTTLDTLSVSAKYYEAATERLAERGVMFLETTVAWTSSNTDLIAIDGYNMTVNIPTEATEVTITATATCGDATDTKEFKVNLIPLPYAREATLTIPQALELAQVVGGDYTPGKYYVEGTVKSIANTTYGNLYIEDAEGNELYVYGTYDATGANRYDKMENAPQVGDTVKVYGVLGTYKDTAQFKNAWVVEHKAAEGGEVTPPEGGEDETPDLTTTEGILKALYALADGESLTGPFTITGKITEIDSWSNPTIVVEGFETMPVYCYKLKVTNAVGDTITVTAQSMKNHQGTYEFMDCTLVSSEVGGGDEGGDEGETTLTTTPIATIIASENAKYQAEGTVVGIYARGFILQDSTASILVYLNAVPNVALGDKVTVVGTSGSFNGGAQFGNDTQVTVNSNGAVSAATATVMDGAACDAALALANVDITYVSITGTLNVSGNFYNVTIPGASTAVGSIAYPSEEHKAILADLNGKEITVEGYFFSISKSGGSPKYINILMTNAKEVENGGEEGGETPNPELPPVEHEHNFVDGKCECGEADPDYVAPKEEITTIAGALAGAEGDAASFSGTVSEIYQAWNTQYKNMSFYVTDGTDRILVFRAGTLVGVGDEVSVKGTVTVYNSVNQIAQGSTVTITVAHVCSTFTEADCNNAAVCTVCNKANGEALGHIDEDSNGACDRCTADVGAEVITASKTIADLIVSEGWTNTTTKQSFNLDDVVSVKVNGGSNTGKAYEGNHIRIYATDTPAGTLTISVAEGYELVSVKVSTVTGTYAFLYVDGTTTDICNTTTAVSGSSVVLNSVKNGSNGKQVRVTAIEVVYKAV